jgi:hypothetical protein
MGDENNKGVLDRIKPTYRDGLFIIAGALIDRFGVSYVVNKYKEQKQKEREDIAKMVADMLKDYKKAQ